MEKEKKKTLTISSNLKKKIDTSSISTSGKKSYSVEKKKSFKINKPIAQPKVNLNKESKKKIKNPKFSSHHKFKNVMTPLKSSATYKIGSEKNPHPTYPLIARKKGWEGRVVLQTEVDKQGNVKFIRILESSGFKVLDDISIETLKKWKFKPAKLGNKFVDDIVDIPVKFVLTN